MEWIVVYTRTRLIDSQLISLEFPEKNFELSLEREHCEYRVHSREISMEVCKLHVVWANKKQLM